MFHALRSSDRVVDETKYAAVRNQKRKETPMEYPGSEISYEEVLQ
jgi:hypothetical protein